MYVTQSLFSCCCKENRFHAFISFTFLFVGFYCKTYFLNSSTFLFYLFSLSLTLSVFPLSGSIKTEKSQKNLFTLAENNFGQRKLTSTRLHFGEILFAGTKRAVPFIYIYIYIYIYTLHNGESAFL